ncbi:succinylglutamate desuccinylase/aspartoacylase family protein [Shewanella gelidii]|uniref:Succinylglutamate desuccinylase n=1 Tax=Shewanella gelidii TaxID=1642821 RepID=A0A917NDG9_9GAMM|nr:succinylglutamate desuccinylase/aspartoacylase family protein [Shewanella gelidii]MCL1099343.1 M14 family metallopeptidase [Shewanella gelidii]GGI92161.1 succinylglutamate desuccinylase [Shewanella gelidii]
MSLTQHWQEVGELAAGQHLSIPVYRFGDAASDGLHVYIQANVHGAEVQGNAVIFQLMKRFESMDINGSITLVPLANPLGINQKSGEFTLGRFDPITGVNWNREYVAPDFDMSTWFAAHAHLDDAELFAAFRQELITGCKRQLDNDWGVSTGTRLAAELQQMAHQADIVLDLHTGPKSAKHLYCPEYDLAAACYFSIPHTLVMPNEFAGAMDESAFYPWWQLSDIAAQHGRQIEVPVSAFTLELGNQERIDLIDAEIDAEGILAYLSHRHVIDDHVKPRKMRRNACALQDYKKLYAPMAGMVEYVAPLGKPIRAGQGLVNILRLDLYGTEQEIVEIKAPEDCVPVLHFASASVHLGTEMYKVMTNVFELSCDE